MPTLTWTYTDAIAAVGDPIDYEVFDEIQSNINLVNVAVGPAIGDSTFAGSSGQTITLSSAQPDTSYQVVVTPTADPGGNLGEVWVSTISAAGFKVHNSGSATTAFRWKVIR